jgi:hypothetical protein
MDGRRLGLASFGVGLVVIALAQSTMPAQSPPLYDGIVPLEPYLWLSPPPGQQGGAEGAMATVRLKAAESPLVAVATPESVPQAQVFAAPGTLTLPTGTQSLKVSITPVPTEVQPTDGHIDGNVYRFVVTNQDGAEVTAPREGRVSIVLRAADPLLTDGTLARLVDGVWQPLDSSPAGFGATFLAVVTEFGDFALIASGPGPSESALPTVTPATSPRSLVSASPPSPSATTDVRPVAPGGPTPPLGLIGVLAAISLTAIAAAGFQRRRSRPPRHRQARRVRRR